MIVKRNCVVSSGSRLGMILMRIICSDFLFVIFEVYM